MSSPPVYVALSEHHLRGSGMTIPPPAFSPARRPHFPHPDRILSVFLHPVRTKEGCMKTLRTILFLCAVCSIPSVAQTGEHAYVSPGVKLG